MKWIMILICLSLVGLSGCGEEFMAGVAAGTVAAEKMAEDAQEKFLVAVNTLNKETAKLNASKEAVASIEVSDLIKPETIEAIKSVKGREKDPVTWLALASIIGNGIWAGRTIEKRTKNES